MALRIFRRVQAPAASTNSFTEAVLNLHDKYDMVALYNTKRTPRPPPEQHATVPHGNSQRLCRHCNGTATPAHRFS